MQKVLDQVREYSRMNLYNVRSEQTCVNWIKRLIYFHEKYKPGEMGWHKIRAFFSDFATAWVRLVLVQFDYAVVLSLNNGTGRRPRLRENPVS